MDSNFDILGLGCVAVDDLFYLPSFPLPDSKVRIVRRERQCGGLTATALVAAARLGSRCAYAGILGEDDLSQYVVDSLCNEGIDVTYVRRLPGARPIYSVVVVDGSHQTRTILYDLQGALGAQEDWPPADIIRSAHILFIDHFGAEGMIRAAQIARKARIPVVADFESQETQRFTELLALADHLIVSCDFAEQLAGRAEPAIMATTLCTPGRQAVVVTSGAEGCWFTGAGMEVPVYQPAFRVEAVDTTGCGDVFHGAYASALARGLGLGERVRLAAAAAALKATRRGGQVGCPTLAEAETLMREQTS